MSTEFTPIVSLMGGALIGLSAVLLMLFLGGLASPSRRSLAAVLLFMSGTAATVYVSRHILGISL